MIAGATEHLRRRSAHQRSQEGTPHPSMCFTHAGEGCSSDVLDGRGGGRRWGLALRGRRGGGGNGVRGESAVEVRGLWSG